MRPNDGRNSCPGQGCSRVKFDHAMSVTWFYKHVISESASIQVFIVNFVVRLENKS